MRIENLKSPGTLINSYDLRREACRAINASELYLSEESRVELAEFFLDCAKHVAPDSMFKKKAKEPSGG